MKKSKGITLIALVITIILLLILAGVSLSLVTGSNGILGKAENAVNESNKATAREEMELVIAELKTDYYFKNETGELFDYLKTNLTNYTTASGAIVVCDEKGDITYTKGKTIYTMSLSLDGKIIVDNEKVDKKIRTAQELKAFADEVNSGNSYEGKTVVLMNDIDLGVVYGPYTTYPGELTQIGTESAPFKGTFDGNNHSIQNIMLSKPTNNRGVFGVNNGTVRNLKIKAALFSQSNNSSCENYGIIAGTNNGNIISCETISGEVDGISSGLRNAGGICGKNTGKISNCSNNSGRIAAVYNSGGIAGENSGIIELCYNKCDEIGGNKTSYGYTSAGGVVGVNNGSIMNCYNLGKIVIYAGAGGIAGNVVQNATIENCYSLGNVVAKAEAEGTSIFLSGGIAGSLYSNSNIKNCFYLSGTSIGGLRLRGSDDPPVDVPGQAEAKTEAELKGMAGVLGEAFKPDTNNINNGYPILNWQ